MNKVMYIFLAGLLSVGAIHSHALTTSATLVEEIRTGNDSKSVQLKLAVNSGPANCDRSYYEANADIPNIDHILAYSLAAFTANKEVKVIVYDDRCSTNGFARIRAIWM